MRIAGSVQPVFVVHLSFHIRVDLVCELSMDATFGICANLVCLHIHISKISYDHVVEREGSGCDYRNLCKQGSLHSTFSDQSLLV